MFENTEFCYLDSDDAREFEESWEIDQALLVAGSRTVYRLEKYLSATEFQRVRVILTALVRDFKLPNVRYTSAIALTIYVNNTQKDFNVLDTDKNVSSMELALLLKHLMNDDDDEGNSEIELFDRSLAFVTKRWSEYLKSPNEFVV